MRRKHQNMDLTTGHIVKTVIEALLFFWEGGVQFLFLILHLPGYLHSLDPSLLLVFMLSHESMTPPMSRKNHLMISFLHIYYLHGHHEKCTQEMEFKCLSFKGSATWVKEMLS